MTSTRTGWWRRISAATAALAIGAVTAVATAPSAVADGEIPTVSLDKSTGLNPAGDTITVTGTHIDMTALGTRPPLSGRPGGVYVAVGAFADTWRPSEGAAGGARKLVKVADGGQKWAVLSEDMATVGGATAGAIELNPDGSFTATLTVSKALIDALIDDTHPNIGVVTYPGSGATSAANETFTPITFAEKEVPATTVTVTSASTAGLQLSVTGSNYIEIPPRWNEGAESDAAGVYLALYDANTSTPGDFTISNQGLGNR